MLVKMMGNGSLRKNDIYVHLELNSFTQLDVDFF